MQNELRMNEEMEKIFKKGDDDLIEVLFLKFAVGNEKKKELPGVPAGVQTGDLPNNTSKIYHYHFLLLTPLMISEI